MKKMTISETVQYVLNKYGRRHLCEPEIWAAWELLEYAGFDNPELKTAQMMMRYGGTHGIMQGLRLCLNTSEAKRYNVARKYVMYAYGILAEDFNE